MKYAKVAMIGAGFMSGSLALELHERRLVGGIWAVARDDARAAELMNLGIFDEVKADFESVVRDADVIVLATPVRAMEQQIVRLESYLTSHPDADPLVIDIGSTKVQVNDWVRSHGSRRLCRCFVGSHPLCGSEKQGAQHAVKGLYDRAMCMIVPIDGCDCADTELSGRAAEFWRSVGCRTAVVSETDHDRILAWTSHVPHAVAFAFARCIDKKYFPFTAGSFRGLARLSRSSPEVWSDIFSTNRVQVLDAIESFQRELQELKLHVGRSADTDGRDALLAHLRQAVQLMEQYDGYSD